MSLKELWQKQKESTNPVKTIQQKTLVDFSVEVETQDYASQYKDSIDDFLHDVNFVTASNFAKFGSARKYYENVTNRIVNAGTGKDAYYPYDGSKAEQLEFENNLNPFEKYIFLYEYPRSTGYVNFSPDGWGTITGAIDQGFGKPQTVEYISFYNENQNNIYDLDKGFRENTRFIFSSGSTIEFWLKKDSFPNVSTQTSKECIFYTKTLDGEKRFVLHLSGGVSNTGSLYTQYITDSGSTEKFSFELQTGLQTIADSQWHHYALVYSDDSKGYSVDLYVDGVYKDTDSNIAAVVDLTGSAFCTIGSLGGEVLLPSNLLGYGKLSGSIDEFRFWNTSRDAKQIGLNYFVNVGGGNDLYPNTNIGVYYKFNEGITQTSSVDSVVLDFAGRNCNGLFVGYSSSSRNTGSAITDTQEKAETGTPILYYVHQDLQNYLTDRFYYADEHDFTNNFSLKNSLPSWILDEDSVNGDILINFLQTIASYLDTLHLQITKFKDIKNKEYLNYKGKAPPFADLLLTSAGFDLPSLFLNTDIVQSLLSQDNKRTYDEKIEDLKNIIYKNIYNNLNIIYKSKGTENSIKQLIRTFGVDEDSFALNIYANNTIYTLEDSYSNKSIKKSFVDFTPFVHSANSSAVICQSGSSSYISGTTDYSSSFTAEADVLIPSFSNNYDYLSYQTLLYNTASLFGIRTANSNNEDISVSGSDPAGLKTRFVYRDDKGYFSLFCQTSSVELTSSVFSDVTSNQHWNLSIRLQHQQKEDNYKLIFSGYCNAFSDEFREFEVSSSITKDQGIGILQNNKRLYVGSERDNITGSLQFPSLSKALSVKYWNDFLNNNELKHHARNVENYGRETPSNSSLTSSYNPLSNTLLLHWDFTNITSSDSGGESSVVYDLSSKKYSGKGYGFEADSTIGGREFVYSSVQQLPENLYSSNLIETPSSNDNYLNRLRPQKYFFAIENSMYDVISRNILNMFASVLEFNNLIGEPMNLYKKQYSKLNSFRRIFFEKVQNEPDLDKYVSVYKWIDDALDSILSNLIPASANASEKARTIIENHILERNKINFSLIPDKSVVANNGVKEIKVPGKKNKRVYGKYFTDQINYRGANKPSGFKDPFGFVLGVRISKK